MNEPRKAGRPRKHLAEDHHFKPAEDAVDILGETVEAVVENPIVENAEEIQPSVSIACEELILQPTSDITLTSDKLTPPLEEKIHEVVSEHEPKQTQDDVTGWHAFEADIVSKLPPRNGMPVRILASDGQEVIAFWKRTRAMANTTKKWEETGHWRDFQTGMQVNFEPKYWKERF